MRRPTPVVCLLLLIVTALHALTSTLEAQSRVLVRPEVRPNLVLHVTADEEFTVGLEAGILGPGPAEMSSRTLLAFNQTNGRPGVDGLIPVAVRIERIEMTQLINGKAAADRDLTPLVGQTVSVTVDRSGTLLDVALPAQAQQYQPLVRQVLVAAFSTSRALPDMAMAPGESTTLDADLPMRVPGAAENPAPLRVTTTFRQVNAGAGGRRVARLEQRIESSPNADLIVQGAGTTDVNLDRGFVGNSTTEWAFSFSPTAAGAAPSAMSGAKGTIKVTVTAME
jgi:hypothetical protein